MTETATISSSVLHGLSRSVAAAHNDPRQLAMLCNLPEPLVTAEDSELPLRRFVAALECASARCGDPSLGWKAGRHFDLRFLGDLGDAMLEAPTVGAALHTFSDYLHLVQSATDLRVEICGDEVTFTYRILDPDIWPRQQDAEFSMSVVNSLLHRGVDRDWRPLSVTYEHPRSMTTIRSEEPISAVCDFDGNTNRMVFPARVLDCPIDGGDRHLWSHDARRLSRALAARRRNRSVSVRTENAILRALGHSDPNQTRIARELGLSARSLHRHLKAEGTSFSRILSDCRLRLAKHRLAHSDESFAQLASELGYSDQTAFSRAFRLASGLSPKAYRENHRARA